MTDKNNYASSRRRFLGVAAVGVLLAVGAGAQAMRVRARQTPSVSPHEVQVFFHDFDALFDSGDLSLVGIFDVLAARQNNPAFCAIIQQISDELAQGATLSKEMAKFPQVFRSDYIAVIQGGEYYGTLENSLHQLAQRA